MTRLHNTLVYKRILKSDLYKNEITKILDGIKNNMIILHSKVYSSMVRYEVHHNNTMIHSTISIYGNNVTNELKKLILEMYWYDIFSIKEKIKKNGVLGNLKDSEENRYRVEKTINQLFIQAAEDKIEQAIEQIDEVDNSIIIRESIDGVRKTFSGDSKILELIDEMEGSITSYMKMVIVSK